MRFLFGVVVGLVAAHWYYTQGGTTRVMIEEMWNDASAPPARVREADPERGGAARRR
jgi:hypothetical protein